MQFLTYLWLHAETAHSLECLRVRQMVAFYVFRKELHVLCIFWGTILCAFTYFPPLFCRLCLNNLFSVLFLRVNRECFGSLISNSRRLFNDPICICFHGSVSRLSSGTVFLLYFAGRRICNESFYANWQFSKSFSSLFHVKYFLCRKISRSFSRKYECKNVFHKTFSTQILPPYSKIS